MISLSRWPKVEDLRTKLNGKAKARPRYRFYSLYDKVYRKDVLEAAYAQCRSNAGAPGVDGQTFEDIEAYGVERYLGELAGELKELRYRPQPVQRVLIPKEHQPGKFRPLGIPTIRDRVVQQAVKLLLEPIFEADFTDNAYGYRAKRSAGDAVREVDQSLRAKFTDVVDADLSKYFDTIPHEQLLKSVERRISDHKVLWLIRAWLKSPVQEKNAKGRMVITGGKKTRVGTPQGGVISPLLANIYFRRFLKAWDELGYGQEFCSRIVNYADDFVILTQKHAQEALKTARALLRKLHLNLNESKTRTVNGWDNSFDFLGYTFGKYHRWRGKAFLSQAPSKRNLKAYRESIREETGADRTCKTAEQVAQRLNWITRGFWNYFNQGMNSRMKHNLDKYLWNRMKQWVCRKHRKLKSRARYEAVKTATSRLKYGRDVPNRQWLANAARFVTVPS